MIGAPGYNSPAAPKPMYMSKPAIASAPTDVPTPLSTPPPQETAMRKIAATTITAPSPKKDLSFKADAEEGKSPQLLSTDPTGTPPMSKDDELPEAVAMRKAQEEDNEDVSKDREGDIYADAVLQCSIENKEACVMCSG